MKRMLRGVSKSPSKKRSEPGSRDRDRDSVSARSGGRDSTARGRRGGGGRSEPPEVGKSTRVGEVGGDKDGSGATAVRSLSRSSNEIDFALRKKKGVFSFEFAKAEIVDIVKAISDMTRQNYIVPEKLKSQRLTILSPTKITASEAYRVFFAALAANGITIVPVGKFHKLVESKDAVKETIPTCVGPHEDCSTINDQMVTVILHMRHTDASQINGVVKSLISKEGEITLFQPTNALIISEYAPNLERVRRIINALDVPGFDDELRIVQIHYATAPEIADKLTQIFEVQARGGSGSRGSSGRTSSVRRRRAGDNKSSSGSDAGDDEDEVQISKIIPDERTNQIIIKANRKSFPAIDGLIAKLDVPVSDAEQGRVRVYYLENADAEELASTLSSLAQGGGGQQRTRPKTPAGRAKGSSNRSSEAQTAELFEGEIKITADKSTNSLIIVASPSDFRALRAIIEELDVPRRQVYVEVAILEVNVTDEDKFALDWHAPLRFAPGQLGGYGGGNSLGFLQSAGGSPTIGALATPGALLQVAQGSVAGVIGKGVDVPGTDGALQVPSFGVLLQWLQSSSNANILSTPHVLTTDNEEATIEVGQKVPFMRGGMVPGLGGLGNLGGLLGGAAGGDSGNLQNMASRYLGGGFGGYGYGGYGGLTDRIDVSLKLTLTPHINERDKIKLEIDQQIEDLVGKEETTGQPITANRATKTVVVVDDQQTVVLGGLMRDRTTESESKIPILGDLPIFGWLFKDRTTQVEKVNLLLVLTPYIIDGADDFRRIFERKMAEHEEFVADYYGDRSTYRAHIDYSRKSGPFARLAATVSRERDRYENGGTGGGQEILVKPASGETSSAEPPPPSGDSGVPGGAADEGVAVGVPRDEDRSAAQPSLPASGVQSEAAERTAIDTEER